MKPRGADDIEDAFEDQVSLIVLPGDWDISVEKPRYILKSIKKSKTTSDKFSVTRNWQNLIYILYLALKKNIICLHVTNVGFLVELSSSLWILVLF